MLAAPPLDKLALLRRLEAAGLPVPRFVALEPGVTLDPAEWGRYVVVKPSLGARGALVRLQRTGGVRYRPPEELPEDHPGRLGPMIAQRFIHTGDWPVSYRVLTFLGEPLLALRFDGNRARPPLTSLDQVPSGVSVVAPARGATLSLAPEADLIELGRRIHAALPDFPILGIDLMREAATGRLFIAETNLRYCWSLSNQSGKEAQAQFGLDFYAQYDALERAAQALVRATRALAR